jgi:hypothetical protein
MGQSASAGSCPPSGKPHFILLGTRRNLMRQPVIDDYVRLVKDIPELGLVRNEIGVVRSTWFAPEIAYEVEFHPRGQDHQTRALLLAEQVSVEDGPLFDEAALVRSDDYHAHLA